MTQMKKSKTGLFGNKNHGAIGPKHALSKKAVAKTTSAGPKKTSSMVHSKTVTKKHSPIKKG